MVSNRPDGREIRAVHPLRKVMWHLMPGRNQSAVYFEQQVDVASAQELGRRLTTEGPDKVTLFHLVLQAAARVLHEHPRLNRFVSGRKLYQRNAVEIAFSIKKSFDEDAPIIAVKRIFPPEETLPQMVGALNALISRGRRGRDGSRTDLEVRLAARLPRPITAAAVRALKGLDGLGLLPPGMIQGDPLFASLFVANLGSLGLEAGFHHLYEYGNIPIFLTMGRVARQPVVVVDTRGSERVEIRPMMRLRYTFDERIEDGFAAARALGALQGYLEAPEQLLP